MVNILLKDKKYILLDFESESDFEKAVIENSKILFGDNTVYLDTKKRIGAHESYHKTVPDGYLIDFSNKKQPQLYFVENELSTHDIYSHITEQLGRFSTSIKTSPIQIRTKLLEVIKKEPKLLKDLEKYIIDTPFSNIDELMNFLVDNKIKIVLVINEETTDLNLSLDIFRERPDIVILQRYQSAGDVAYLYEPMREELSDLSSASTKKSRDFEFDTIVCPAFKDGFKHAYVENNAWWAIRISQKAREQLRYLAIYEKSPVAAVQNVAEIERIEPYKDSGKFIVYLKNKKKIRPITLDKGKKGVAPQSSRYTTYEKLRRAKKISELWK